MKYDFDRVRDRRASESLKWNYAERVLKARDVIPMWVADMDFEAPPAVVEAVKARAEHGIFGYPLIPRSFFEAAAGWLETRHGWRVEPGWMTAAPGIVPALHLAVRALAGPGEGVIIQTPVYRPFFQAVNLNGRRLVRNPLRFEAGAWRMDLDDLERKAGAGARLLILCSPHNPVGRVWTREELEALGRVVVERDLIVVSDEIHHDFVFGGRRHVPFASLSEELASRTLTCVAPNKTFNLAGLATGIVLSSNSSLLARFSEEHDRAGLGVINVFGIAALEAAYRHGADWLDELLAYLEANMSFAEDFVRRQAPGLEFIVPEGTYLGLLDCRGLGLAQQELDDFFLRKAGVLFEPGTTYGEELQGYERVNLACPRAILAEALGRVARAARELKSGR
jgi:cystathionine beta-lyase